MRHFNARHKQRPNQQRPNQQRSVLDRRAEGAVAVNARFCTESLTCAWRQSAGTRLYVGATRARQGRGPTTSAITGPTEAFIKLEPDADDLRALLPY